MRFRSEFFNWIVDHPDAAGGFALVVSILLLAILPLLISFLPIKKVPIKYNFRNLQVRWLTTAVTAFAFFMVTALMTVMLAFTNGMRNMTASTGHPGNVMVLSDGATDEAFSNLPAFSIELLPGEIQGLIEKSSDGKSPLVAQEVFVIGTVAIPNPEPNGRKRRFVQMRGIDKLDVAAMLHGIELDVGGNWPSPSGVREIPRVVDGKTVVDTAPEIVVGNGVAKTLGADQGKDILGVGDIVEIGPRRWVVAGIMKAANSSYASEIWARDRAVQENFGRRDSYSTYVVRTGSADLAKAAAEALKNFRSERNLSAMPERDYYAKMTETSTAFTYAIYFVASIMAIGGMLGVMNTMFAAISQRTKDVGVLRLMGYGRWQILTTFQFESLVIAIVGGGLGVFVAYLLADGLTATSIMSSGGGGGKTVVIRMAVDFPTIVMGMIFSVLMGALGGIIPSINAVRLRPLESLK